MCAEKQEYAKLIHLGNYKYVSRVYEGERGIYVKGGKGMVYRSLFQRTNIDFRFLPIHSPKLVYHLELLIQNSNIFAPAVEVWREGSGI